MGRPRRSTTPTTHIRTAIGRVIDVIMWLGTVVEVTATPVELSFTSADPQYHRAEM